MSEIISPDDTKGNAEEKEIIALVMRQTDYDENFTKLKLKEHNCNVETIIREYMGLPIKRENKTPSTTTNQKIYQEIRKFLDEASATHRKKQEAESEKV